MNNKFGMFLLGGALGALAALLYAPRSGTETRALVADKAQEAWGSAQQLSTEAGQRTAQLYKTASEAAIQTGERTAEAAQSAFSAAQEKVNAVRENVEPLFAEKNDELREKIEEARKRIAAQVSDSVVAPLDAAATLAADAAAAIEASDEEDELGEELIAPWALKEAEAEKDSVPAHEATAEVTPDDPVREM